FSPEDIEFMDREADRIVEPFLTRFAREEAAARELYEAECRVRGLDLEAAGDLSEATRILAGHPSHEAQVKNDFMLMDPYLDGSIEFPDQEKEESGFGTRKDPLPGQTFLRRRLFRPPFFSESGSRSTILAGWATESPSVDRRDGILGGDCGFAVPGGEGRTRTTLRSPRFRPGPQTTDMDVEFVLFNAYDFFTVGTIGYASSITRLDIAILDLTSGTSVLERSDETGIRWTVFGGMGIRKPQTIRTKFQIKPFQNADLVVQAIITNTAGGGGVIVGAHNKTYSRLIQFSVDEFR
ncbi:MAG: hypothetical protein AAF733_09035, partial [Verrucomicrobiota bacterium]